MCCLHESPGTFIHLSDTCPKEVKVCILSWFNDSPIFLTVKIEELSLYLNEIPDKLLLKVNLVQGVMPF